MSCNPQQSAIQYRFAKPKELHAIVDLVSRSFLEYPLFSFVFRDAFSSQADYLKFIETLFSMYIRSIGRKNDCLVGVQNGTIVSMALVEKPKNRHVGLLNNIVSGGWRLPMQVGVRRLIDFSRICNETEKDCFARYSDAWYVELLAVKSDCRGQQLGSRMIHDCLIPYVRQRGGTEITLMTNTEPNRRFYVKNGFTEFLSQMVERNGITVGNWSYYMSLDDPTPAR
ncbi:GNAT family N-acetyltransferase [Bifidobacterium aquikefiricola]|uniref:GNAT family N-acetyltransferase n=1 Tax=Bifidobacterium aquikefiricola TaxID=3059038 RepID=A0AB39U7I3_9BIFI